LVIVVALTAPVSTPLGVAPGPDAAPPKAQPATLRTKTSAKAPVRKRISRFDWFTCFMLTLQKNIGGGLGRISSQSHKFL
jgi:hypothetical protein